MVGVVDDVVASSGCGLQVLLYRMAVVNCGNQLFSASAQWRRRIVEAVVGKHDANEIDLGSIGNATAP